MKRFLIPLAYSDLKIWPVPDPNVLDPIAQEKYFKRKNAVQMYADGALFESIKIETGKAEGEVRRLVKRCLKIGGDGQIYGFFALLDQVRIVSYSRNFTVDHQKGDGSGGCAGAMTQLFQRFPEVETYVLDLYLRRRPTAEVQEARISIFAIHSEFKKKLRKLGFTDSDWPFNTENCGYKSLWKYFNDYQLSNTQSAAAARSGIDAARRGSVGNGKRPLIPNLRAFSFLQLDFHKVDAASIIIITNDAGVEFEIPVSRWYFGLLVEELYGAVCGFYITLESTPSGDSTLEVIDSALRPGEFDSSDPRYKLINDGKILINQLIPELSHQCFSALKVDNAWSNSAHEVVNNIIDTVGCAINFGPTRAWWRRNLIERIFGELTRHGLQRLPSTHGSGPVDTRSNDPNGKAIKFRILISDLISIISSVLRDHNMSIGEGGQWASPVASLKASLANPASGFFPQSLPLSVQQSSQLMMHAEVVTVRGSVVKNERPYFKLDRCRHTNEKLANAFWLIGKELVTYTDRRKCRIVYATVRETGEKLGLMRPSGIWAKSDLSWRDRKLLNRSGFALKYGDDTTDPMQRWREAKIKELRARPKSKTKRSSKVALDLAKSIERKTTLSNRATSENFIRNQDDDFSYNKFPDPFGLNIVPKIGPTKRR